MTKQFNQFKIIKRRYETLGETYELEMANIYYVDNLYMFSEMDENSFENS